MHPSLLSKLLQCSLQGQKPTNWRRSGRLVQISGPRGRKSLPTSASRTLDFPLLWLPTTATCGKSGVNSSLTYSSGVVQSLQRPGGSQCMRKPDIGKRLESFFL